MECGLIVDCNLFTLSDVAQGNEEDVFVENLHVGVRFATMVDVMRTVSAIAAIQTPAIIDRADAELSSAGSPVRL